MADFLTASTRLPPYLVFPRFLLDLDISETAKLLYMILLDRARLSLQNDGWTDESGHVFIFYTIKNMAVTLHRSEMTIKTALSVLSDQDLILRIRQGAGNPNRIFVKVVPDGQKTIPAITDRKPSAARIKNCPTDSKKAVRHRERKLSTNDSEKNNMKQIQQENDAAITLGSYHNVLLSEQELSALQADFSDWTVYVERLSAYMASTGKTYQNHAATIRLWASKDKQKTTQPTRIYECKEGESL